MHKPMMLPGICGVAYIFPYTSEAMFLRCVFCGTLPESLVRINLAYNAFSGIFKYFSEYLP